MAKRNQFNFLIRKFPKRMQKKLALSVFGSHGSFCYFNRKYYDDQRDPVEINIPKSVLDQQVYDSRAIPFKRGDIVDRNGTKLATSERVYNLILDAKSTGERQKS